MGGKTACLICVPWERSLLCGLPGLWDLLQLLPVQGVGTSVAGMWDEAPATQYFQRPVGLRGGGERGAFPWLESGREIPKHSELPGGLAGACAPTVRW